MHGQKIVSPMAGPLNLAFAVFALLIGLTRQQNCQPLSIRGTDVTNLNLTSQVVFETDVNISLHVTISWDLENTNNVTLDGTLIRIRDSSENIIRGFCDLGRTAFWVTANSSFCAGLAKSNCSSATPANDVCVCNLDLCPDRADECRRGRPVAQSLEDGFFSLMPGVSNVTFVGDFETTYDATIRPYSGIGTNTFIPFMVAGTTSDCMRLVLQDLAVNETFAAKLCCGAGQSFRTPRNVTVFDFVPDFRTETVNASVTWLDPTEEGKLFSNAVAQLVSDNTIEVVGTPAVPFSLPADDPFATPCDNSTAYTSTLVGLQIGKRYILQIQVNYTNEHAQCGGNVRNCRAEIQFFVGDLDLCQYNLCDANANCFDGLNSFDVNCTCSVGYEGNGVNNITASGGCSDQNFCFPDTNPCVPEANCTDNVAPEVGAQCRCRSGFYGDGIAGQGGCNSITNLALAISLPIAVLILIIIAIVAWKVRERRIREKVLTWEQFVTSKALLANKEFNTEEIGEENYVSMFGDEWELDRNNLEVGEVIGRGNYGIVYKGCLKSVDVAIKTIQDGMRLEERLNDFLHEINFMLNVGKHRHVISVLGCCSTQKPVLLITEFLKYGDLKHFLHGVRDPLKYKADPTYHVTLKTLTEMACQVAMGMDFLTKQRIIHGDLAARNILVGEGRVCKIADFGLANDVYRYGLVKSHAEKSVPYKWISPERMKPGKFPITTKSDVWSFGNLMYEMVTLGCAPHYDVPDELLYNQLQTGYRMRQPESCGNEMYLIMGKCWKWRIWSRPSFAQLTKMLSTATARSENGVVLSEADNHIYENPTMLPDEIINSQL